MVQRSNLTTNRELVYYKKKLNKKGYKIVKISLIKKFLEDKNKLKGFLV